jgi:hypothetical protein
MCHFQHIFDDYEVILDSGKIKEKSNFEDVLALAKGKFSARASDNPESMALFALGGLPFRLLSLSGSLTMAFQDCII